MLQSFDSTARPEQGPPRLAALRQEIAREGLHGFLVPRADAHQGEYVAAHDERLSWLTGFTGSAGFCAVLGDIAGVFVDGRYRVQVKVQTAPEFTPVDWPETGLADWLIKVMPEGGVVGYDPWLHTVDQITQVQKALESHEIGLKPCANLVDRIWSDQPPPPMAPAMAYPAELAGESSEAKRARLAGELTRTGQRSALITLPDSIAWLLNIRGADVARNPIAHGFAVLHDDAHVDLFMAPEKIAGLEDHLGGDVRVHRPAALLAALGTVPGPIRLDPGSAPKLLQTTLEEAGVRVVHGADPCALPKARKNAAEIAGTRAAHLRDAAAMCRFLCWFDEMGETGITEIDMVRHLETCRRESPELRDISFETIAGSGPHGAIMHYRVTEETNRRLQPGDLVVLDSGAQYLDGTTDITRTLPVGTPGKDERAAFTRVLQCMIAVSRLRFPKGLAGRDIEAVGRVPLWLAGQDFDHGLGHGVGVYLSVHEGPQRLSRISHIPLEPGMILSNEPGYYREDAFGIRIENLVAVREAPPIPGADKRKMLAFETLTFVPIDRRLINVAALTADERAWLDAYHGEVRAKVAPLLDGAALTWLNENTSPL